jgi:hypothetical protein
MNQRTSQGQFSQFKIQSAKQEIIDRSHPHTVNMDAALMDENQPLLGTDLERREDDVSTLRGIVDFNPDGDEDNPVEWPTAFKWTIVALLAFMAFTVYVKIHITDNTH